MLQYIPSYIQRTNRTWKAGNDVILRTGNREWEDGIVISHNFSRFSSGWNKFVIDNDLSLLETIVFNLMEEDEATMFVVTFPQRH